MRAERTRPGIHHARCQLQKSKSGGKAGDEITASKRGRHDVGHETPDDKSNVSNEGRNVFFDKTAGILERRIHERYKQFVQASLLHASKTVELLADTLHGFESRCLEMTGAMKWKIDKVPLEIHRQTQIRRARLSFAGGTSAEAHLELRQMWLWKDTNNWQAGALCTQSESTHAHTLATSESDHWSHH